MFGSAVVNINCAYSHVACFTATGVGHRFRRGRGVNARNKPLKGVMINNGELVKDARGGV